MRGGEVDGVCVVSVSVGDDDGVRILACVAPVDATPSAEDRVDGGSDMVLNGGEVECLDSVESVSFPEVAAFQFVFSFDGEVDGGAVIVSVGGGGLYVFDGVFDVLGFW